MRKAMRVIAGFIGAMMIVSLAACTPTTEKNKTGQVKETQGSVTSADKSGPGVDADRTPDLEAPNLEIVSIYCVSDDGSSLKSSMDSVDQLDAQTLVDQLIQYGVLDEGTEVVSFETEGTPSSAEVGPGVETIPGMTETESSQKEYGTLELNQFPEDGQKELKAQAVANTFIENMNVTYMTISVNGEAIAENLDFVDAK